MLRDIKLRILCSMWLLIKFNFYLLIIIFQQIVYIWIGYCIRIVTTLLFFRYFIENYSIFINIIFVLFILNYGPINRSLCFQFNDEKIQQAFYWKRNEIHFAPYCAYIKNTWRECSCFHWFYQWMITMQCNYRFNLVSACCNS